MAHIGGLAIIDQPMAELQAHVAESLASLADGSGTVPSEALEKILRMLGVGDGDCAVVLERFDRDGRVEIRSCLAWMLPLAASPLLPASAEVSGEQQEMEELARTATEERTREEKCIVELGEQVEQNKLQAAEAVADAKVEACEKLEERHGKLEVLESELARQKEQAEAAAGNAQKRISSLEEELAHSKTKVEDALANAEFAGQKQLRTSKEEQERLERELSRAQESAAELEAKVAAKESEVKDLRGRSETLQEKVDRLQEELTKTEEAKSDAEARISESDAQVEQNKLQAAKALADAKAEASEKLEEKQGKLEALQSELARQKEQADAAAGNAQKRISSLEEELIQSKKEKDSLERELHKAQESAAELEAKVAAQARISESEDSHRECPRERIVCIGNPGAGKSTLLNSLIGRVVFDSGFSAGAGLTKACTRHESDKAVFVDTPGLADSRHREQAAHEICKALKDDCKYKILWVTTLESGRVRPQDKATMELVLEALERASVDDKYGIVVNKVPVGMDDTSTRDRVTEDLIRGLRGRGKIWWLPEVSECEDADKEILSLSEEFRKFVDDVPSVQIESKHVSDIAWNKFEDLRMRLEAEIQELSGKNKKMRKEIRGLQEEEEQDNTVAESKAEASTESQADRLHGGMQVVVLDRFRVCAASVEGVGEFKELYPGQRGQIVSCDAMELRMQLTPEQDEVRVEKSSFEKLCRLADVEVVKRSKTRELAHRGISLRTLLEFYGKLGDSLMLGSLDPDTGLTRDRFDPEASTTGDVVKGAIIPATKDTGLSYAQHAHRAPLLARRMISHNWGNLFRDLVAAIVADALDLPKYEDVRDRLAPDRLEDLVDELKQAGRLDLVYWVCAFSVNQHKSICKQDWFGCPCETTIHANSSPDCEMDKFDEMMKIMFDPAFSKQTEEQEPARHVVAVDSKGVLFTRAWVVAELVAALCMDCELKQTYKALNEQALEELKSKKGSINILDCKASNEADEEMVKQRAQELITQRESLEDFHARLNTRIFDLLAETGEQINAMKLPHVLCVGNAGVGKSTLINSMLKNATFVDKAAPGELCEQEHNGTVYMEAPGLSDATTRQQAARAITAALKRDGRYTIVFVITLESGRVRPQDKEMIKLVLQAAPIGRTYSVAINKLTKGAINALKDKKVLDEVNQELFSGFEPNLMATNCFWFVKKHASGGIVQLPPRFIEDAPSLYISKGRVERVNEETPEDVACRLSKMKYEIEEENQRLNEKLLKMKNRTQEAGPARHLMDVPNALEVPPPRMLRHVRPLWGRWIEPPDQG